MFRRKQKLIFWGVAIVVIPSFALVWNVGGRAGPSGHYDDPLIAVINSEQLHYSQLRAFSQRLNAGAGLPIRYLTGYNYFRQPQFHPDDNVAMTVIYAHLQLAKRWGVAIPDAEVRHYIRNEHPILSPAFRDQWDHGERRNRILGQTASSYGISPDLLLQGVREWLTLRRFYALERALATPSPDGAYHVYAQSRAQYVVKRLRFPASEALRTRAKGEFDAMDAERQTDELSQTLTRLAGNPTYRTPSRWRFEYLLVPFEKAPNPEPAENELLALYNRRTDLKDAKTFPEVRAQLLEETVRDRRREWALRQIAEEVDRAILHAIGDADPAAAEPPDLAVLAQTPGLARIGVVAGVSGTETATIDELAALPLLADLPDAQTAPHTTVRQYLENLDLAPDDQLDMVREIVMNRFDENSTPMETRDGVLRIRIVEWIPAKALSLTGDDGAVDEAVRTKALDGWVENRAEEFAREQAAAAAETYREGDHSAFEALPAETLSAFAASADIQRRAVDAIGDPQRYAGTPSADAPHDHGDGDDGHDHTEHASAEPGGYELVLLAERRLPSRTDFAALSEVERLQLGVGGGADAFPSQCGQLYATDPSGRPYGVFAVAPGAWLQTWLAELAVNGLFVYNSRVESPQP